MKEIILIASMWLVTFCTYVSYVPQIIKLIKTKKSEDLSVTSWILWNISSLANVIYSIALGRFELLVASISEALLVLATLILTIYYNHKNSYLVESEKKFQERIDKIRAKDGNHMILVTAMINERTRRRNENK